MAQVATTAARKSAIRKEFENRVAHKPPNPYPASNAGVAEVVDARDLKSLAS
jgi:hypothetical protein